MDSPIGTSLGEAVNPPGSGVAAAADALAHGPAASPPPPPASAEPQPRETGIPDAEFVPAGHFYSVIPARAARDHFLASPEPVYVPELVAGIDLNLPAQRMHLDTILSVYDQRIHTDAPAGGRRYGYVNTAYSYGDAFSLQAMLTRLRPRRIVEVGSGHSSAFMLDFIAAHGLDTQCTFVEPYPELLLSLVQPQDWDRITVITKGVQDCDPAVFLSLEAGDVLFIDSTHVSKLGSDVNTLYFDLLPRVKPGVIIHIHDIFWPFEYPRQWIAEGRAWNEIYLLRAMLIGSNLFAIEFLSDYMYHVHQDELASKAPLILRNFGGHVWLKKLR